MSGYALFEHEKLIDHGTIKLGKKDDIYENILFSAQCAIVKLIDTTQANIVVIEDIQLQNRNVSTYKKLALLMGALLSKFQELDKPFTIVPPTRWRSFCQIKGRKRSEQKENTLTFAKEQFGLCDISEDTADAVAMGWWAVNNSEIMCTGKEGN